MWCAIDSPDSDAGIDTPGECAAIFSAAENLGLESGMVVAVPNPAPLDPSVMDAIIKNALVEACVLVFARAHVCMCACLCVIESLTNDRSLHTVLVSL